MTGGRKAEQSGEYAFQGETEEKLRMEKAENQLDSWTRTAEMCIREAKVEDCMYVCMYVCISRVCLLKLGTVKQGKSIR